ncbi:GIY-YIG nuclease family protein [Halobellus sp. Atlit-31R]|nr:GIY-YIG nuclease family protein [Halobellus sp. Atlit-31R]
MCGERAEQTSGADAHDTRDDPAVVLDPDAIAAGADGLGIGDAPPGTYALVFELDADATFTVGALGAATFPAGAYAYVGSAFGSNGLGRVDRHRRVAAGDHDVTHWHVDYLGSHPETSLDAVVAAPHADVECRLAAALTAARTASDGASDHGGSASDGASGHGATAPAGSSDRGTATQSDRNGAAAAPLEGFGASDCDCRTHLALAPDARTLRSAVVGALRELVE